MDLARARAVLDGDGLLWFADEALHREACAVVLAALDGGDTRGVLIEPEAFDRAAAYAASWYTSGVWNALMPAEKDYYRGKVSKLLELCGLEAGQEET